MQFPVDLLRKLDPQPVPKKSVYIGHKQNAAAGPPQPGPHGRQRILQQGSFIYLHQ
jgi:hypothetical protein